MVLGIGIIVVIAIGFLMAAALTLIDMFGDMQDIVDQLNGEIDAAKNENRQLKEQMEEKDKEFVKLLTAFIKKPKVTDNNKENK